MNEEGFRVRLAWEHSRVVRSHRPFVLMLLDSREQVGSDEQLLLRALPAITSSTRGTDVIGWCGSGEILGVIFTEIGAIRNPAIAEALENKIANRLREQLGASSAAKIAIYTLNFPDTDNLAELNQEKLSLPQVVSTLPIFPTKTYKPEAAPQTILVS